MGKRNIYKFSFEDESRLELIKQVRMTGPGLAIRLFLCIALLFAISFLIIAFTPIRKIIPGYLQEADRDATLEYVMRLDSINEAYLRERAFLNNFITVMNTDRIPADSTGLVANPSPMTVDSLLGPSAAEQRFRTNMEQKERYNLSVLAPLAADGMLFSSISEEAVITEKSRNSTKAEVILAKGNPVRAVADGTILDAHFDSKMRGYTVIIQHDRGFVSRYSSLGSPLVETGDHIDSGQIIALQGDGLGSGNSIITLEMWRNGDSMIPSQILL